MRAAGAPHSDKERVVTSSALKASSLLGLTGAELADVLSVSPGQVSGFRNGQKTLAIDSGPYQAAVALLRIYRSLAGIVGEDKEYLRGWLNADNRALNGKPRELIRKYQGLYNVLQYLDNARAQI